VKKQEVLILSVWCSFNYPIYKAHVPYCIVIFGLFDCAMFFHIIS